MQSLAMELLLRLAMKFLLRIVILALCLSVIFVLFITFFGENEANHTTNVPNVVTKGIGYDTLNLDDSLKESALSSTYDCDYSLRQKSIPDYRGVYGYLYSKRPSSGKYQYSLPMSAENWFVPRYKQVGPTAWAESGDTLKHKSYVKVTAQHLDYHFHVKGLLEISVLHDDGSSSYEMVNYNNFTPVKYWECPVEKAVKFSPVVAQVKNMTRPLDVNGVWLSPVAAGDKVFCTESYYKRHSNIKLKSIDMPVKCWVYSLENYGYFEAKNLNVVY